MILSIGMIVKNEEKYLERCLTALKPLLENVDSELIIADTGSTDGTVEIAKKFTDNVFHFDWINDFAAARNSTLERAKGEWFMFIDADEIAEDCSDIIHFFNSGEYKKYGSAAYTQRSYSDSAKPDLYLDLNVRRLTVIKDGVRFEKPIHETLDPAMAPCKILKFVVDHYGYIFTDNGVTNEFAREKAERNLKILHDELAGQEASGKIRYSIYGQLADCYHVIGDKETALEYLNKGMAMIDPRDLNIMTYYTRILAALCDMARPVEAIEVCDKYFSKENLARTKTLATDCFVYFVRGLSSFTLHNYDRSVSDFVSAFHLYDKYINDKLSTEDLLITTWRVTIPLVKTCGELLYKSCHQTGRYSEAAEVLRKFPVSLCLSDQNYMLNHLLLRTELMEHTDFSSLAGLYNQLDGFNKKRYLVVILWHLFKTNKPESAVNNLKSIAKGDKRLEDTVEIYNHFFVKNDLTFEAVKEFISKHGALGNEQIWCVMMLSGFDITPFITAENFNPEQCVRTVFSYYKNGQSAADLFADYDINLISPDVLEKTSVIYEWAMIGARQNKVDIAPLFEKFGIIGERWFENFPNLEAIPGDIKVSLIVGGIVSARKSGNYALCTSEMNRLAMACPPFEPFVSAYGESVQQEVNSSAPAPASDANEFTRLAEKLKQNIRVMIDGGNIGDAEELISEYEKLCPDDPEINVLKKQVEAEK